jgi:exo-beta-1,3-glucanase (GH17 family)
MKLNRRNFLKGSIGVLSGFMFPTFSLANQLNSDNSLENVVRFSTTPNLVTNTPGYLVVDAFDSSSVDRVTVNGEEAELKSFPLDQFKYVEHYVPLNSGDNPIILSSFLNGSQISEHSKNVSKVDHVEIKNDLAFQTIISYQVPDGRLTAIYNLKTGESIGAIPSNMNAFSEDFSRATFMGDSNTYGLLFNLQNLENLPIDFYASQPIYNHRESSPFLVNDHTVFFPTLGFIDLNNNERIPFPNELDGFCKQEGLKLNSFKLKDGDIRVAEADLSALTSRVIGEFPQEKDLFGGVYLDNDRNRLWLSSYAWGRGVLNVFDSDTKQLVARHEITDYPGKIVPYGDKVLVGTAGNPSWGDGRVYTFDRDNLTLLGETGLQGARVILKPKSGGIYVSSYIPYDGNDKRSSLTFRRAEIQDNIVRENKSRILSAFSGNYFEIFSGSESTPLDPVENPPESPFDLRFLLEDKFISYNPTNYNPDHSIWPSEDSIKRDLEVLVGLGFTGISTYGANNGLKKIPQLAKEMGFKRVLMGIYDLKKATSGLVEWENALDASTYVDGYIAGNEGLEVRSYTISELRDYHNELRNMTNKPVTSSETNPFYDREDVRLVGDWLSPNVHPYWEGIRNAQVAADRIEARHNQLKSLAGNKLVLVRENGFPTAGADDVSEELQANFYAALFKKTIPFGFFEAFDQQWKNWNPVEPHWGIFDKDRNPKPVASVLSQYLRKSGADSDCYFYR